MTILPELLAGASGMWLAAAAIHESPAATLVGVVTWMSPAASSPVLTTAIRTVRMRVAVVHTLSTVKGAPCAMLRSICEPSPSSET